MKDDIAETLRGLVVDVLGSDPAAVTDDAFLMDDLGADSLDLVELCIAAEDEFDISLPDDWPPSGISFKEYCYVIALKVSDKADIGWIQ